MIYVECKSIICDNDFLQTDVAFAAYARERQDADVHVLITGQPTVDGGSEATLTFIGQKEFVGVDDALRYVSPPAATSDQLRRGLASAIKRGLVRYANRTALGTDLAVSYSPSVPRTAASVHDAWNGWTLATSLNGVLNGEQLVQTMNVGASLAANRTTDTWKITTRVQSQYSRSQFELAEANSLTSTQRTHAASTLIAYGLNEHVSIGTRVSAVSSSYLNQRLTVRTAPALEYNFFRYDESTRRIFSVEYSVGASAFNYREETIFGKASERRLDERALATVILNQPWGTLSVAAEASHYLDAFRRNRGIVFCSMDWNLAKGFAVSSSINFQRVRDQIYLSRRGASTEDILLRQKQLATSYSYSAAFGIRYTFGSPYASVVNRRFEGSVAGSTLQ